MLKTLSSHPVISTRWLRVVRQQVQTSGGQVVDDYYVARKADFVMVVAITEAGEILLVREWKQGVKAYVWNLPVGGVEEGESPRKTIERELLEETGYTATGYQLLGNHWHVSSSWLEDRAYLFYAVGARRAGEPKVEGTEDIEVVLVSFEKAVEMVHNGQITDPYTALAILWAKEEIGKNGGAGSI